MLPQNLQTHITTRLIEQEQKHRSQQFSESGRLDYFSRLTAATAVASMAIHAAFQAAGHLSQAQSFSPRQVVWFPIPSSPTTLLIKLYLLFNIF